MRKLNLFILLTIIVIAITFDGCRKKEEPKTTESPVVLDEETGSLIRYNDAAQISFDLTRIGMQISETGSLSLAPCASVSISGKTFTVDFGELGCTGLDGILRSGKLMYDYSSSTNNAVSFKMPGFCLKINSLNYLANSYKLVVNSKTIRNTSPLSVSGQTAYSGVNLTWTDSSNISTINPTGFFGASSWIDARTVTLLNTNDTSCYRGQTNAMNCVKLKLRMNGNSSGAISLSQGPNYILAPENFTATFNDLYKDFSCLVNIDTQFNVFTSGTLSFTPGSRVLRYVDFGTGNCDGLCTITFGNGVPRVYAAQ